MKKTGLLLAFFGSLSLVSCHLFQKSKQEEIQVLIPLRSEMIDSLPGLPPSEPEPIVLRVWQSGCGGPCPEWDARFYASGEGTLEGFAGAVPKGAYRTRIDPDSVWQWSRKADAIGFFTLPDSLPESGEFLKGLPTMSLEIRKDTMVHSVVHNYQGPVSLRNFERQLETWIFSHPWERIED